MRVRIAAIAMASAVAAGTLTGGCSGGDEKEAGPKTTVLVPGRPGEPNRTELRGPASQPPPNAGEIRFVQMMIPHHRQAVEMARLAPQRASSAQVRSLAERINGGQQAEISSMESLLRQKAGTASTPPGGGHGGHGSPSAGATAHANMPGMATPQQMRRLGAAKGTEFDRLFLTLVIIHHQGALTMVKDVLGKGTDVLIQELALEVRAGQQAEIDRMRALVDGM